MEPIKSLTSKTVVIPLENIDTDQITPARYLKGTSKKLAGAFFIDWRQDPEFTLNKPGAKGASILVAADNYGCGSSREHAAWAAYDYGIRALVSTSIADIHRNNCLKNGIVPIVVDEPTLKEALAAAEKNLEFTIDLPNQTLTLPSGKKVAFQIGAFYKKCMVGGLDELDYLKTHEAAVVAFEKRHDAARA